jgi:hypothetical protein
MDHTQKTLYYVGVALVLAVIAYFATPSKITPEAFLDQGEAFFPDFTDPNTATSLEIVEIDPATGTPKPFKVHFKDGLWTIPSHHDYPADAKDRLAKTAAGVIDIRKDDFRSDLVADHEATGTIDPLDETATSIGGRGKRVTIRGENDVILADFIVGKPVTGNQPVTSGQGMRFVRVPGQKRVYAAKVNVDLSTRFADWINTDLLEITKANIDRVTINDYSINERSGSINQRDRISLKRDGDQWKADKMARGQIVDTTAISELLATLDSLAIVGVRPKPEGLTRSLSAAGDGEPMSNADLMSLQSKGYFLTRDGQLVSNEGEVQFHTADGVEYVLRFGEVLYGGGLAVTAGGGKSTEGSGEAENRYLMVTTSFDPSGVKEPAKPGNEDFRTRPDSLLTDTDRANKQLAAAHDAWQRKLDQGKARSAELNRRFADWYYVISAKSFDKLKLPRQALVVSAS